MEYDQLRKEILKHLNGLQERKISYQSICDYINSQQTDFVLYKDFFSRFQSGPTYFGSAAKQKKLSLIHQHLEGFYRQNMEKEVSTNDVLKKIVSNAAMAKFEIYLEASRSTTFDPSSLTDFYLENGPAYLNIRNKLKHRNQYGWELDILNYGSTFKILSTQISSLFTSSAVVVTKEFWDLCWVNKISRKLQFRFKMVDQQSYLLSKGGEGRWKIVESVLKTNTNKIEPEYIDFLTLEQLSSDDREENKMTVANFLANNELLHCIEFIRRTYPGKLRKNEVSILNRIKQSYLNSHRLLNTNVIKFDIYKSEMELLNKQTRLICDAIFLKNK